MSIETNRFRDRSNPRGRSVTYVPQPTPAPAPLANSRPILPVDAVSGPITPVANTPVHRPIAPQPVPQNRIPRQVASPPRPSASPTTNSVVPPAAPATTNVSINISLPKLHRPTLPRLPYKRVAITAGVVVAVAVVGLLARHFISQAITHHREYQAAHQAAAAQGPTRTQPNFIPLVPAGKASLASVGAHSAFDGTRDTYSFSDTFKGTSLTVSQQPVPASFKSSSQAVATVAKSLGATTPVLANSGTGYLATDQKSGSQTVIFSLNDVLVFVQSPFSHTATDWASYLGLLK